MSISVSSGEDTGATCLKESKGGEAGVPLIVRCVIWASCFTSLSLHFHVFKKKHKNNDSYSVGCWED